MAFELHKHQHSLSLEWRVHKFDSSTHTLLDLSLGYLKAMHQTMFQDEYLIQPGLNTIPMRFIL